MTDTNGAYTPTRERDVDDKPKAGGPTYTRLAAHFDKHHKDPRGMEYLTGNQVVGRLNEVLGFDGWSFSVREHGFDAEADEVWALGRLEVYVTNWKADNGTGAPLGTLALVREQFGSQKHNRKRSDGSILDYGFDLKGATTDSLKKCATLIGVGLYLSEKDGGIPQDQSSPPPPPADDLFVCVECKHPIVAQTGEFINASQAKLIRDRFGSLVCKEHRAVKAG